MVYFQVSESPLNIQVQKRDLNIYNGEDTLVVRLLSPEHTIIREVEFSDDGNARAGGGMSSRVQSKRLEVKGPPGIYVLHFLCQGSDQVYGFRSNCTRYLISGEIFLNDYTLPGEIYFMPPDGEFSISVTAVHKPGIQKVPLLDGQGKIIHHFMPEEPMKPVRFLASGNLPRAGHPWKLQLQRQDVRIEIQNVKLWSNRADSFFELKSIRGMLTPYSIRLVEPAGTEKLLIFELRNQRPTAEKLALDLESGKGLQLRMLEPETPIHLAPKGFVEVRIAARILPSAKGKISARVTAVYLSKPELRTTSAIEIQVGAPRAGKTLKLPIVNKPYQHENAQFAFCPDYPANVPFFDQDNRPFIRHRTSDRNFTRGLYTLENGRWVERSFLPAIRARYSDFARTRRAAGWHNTRTVSDQKNNLYTLVQIVLSNKSSLWLLLFSQDGGRHYRITELPPGTPEIEPWSGHNELPGPPPILIYSKTRDHPARFASFHDLNLYRPSIQNGKVVLDKPVLLSRKCVGSCQHSGAPPASVTVADRTHVVWGEIDDPGAPGVPTFVATWDARTKTLSKKVFLAHGPPVNDVHNVPGICADSKGTLHVVTGAHGSEFQYTRSLQPNAATGGWTKPVPVLTAGAVDKTSGPKGRGRQTYLSLFCDSRDTLHIAFRQWRAGVDPFFGGSNYAALSYQRKPKDRPWSGAVPLVVPPLPGYSIYYHKMSLDRTDRLYLSYSYYSKDENYRNFLPGLYDYRAVITSKDRGRTWKLAQTADFAEGMAHFAGKRAE